MIYIFKKLVILIILVIWVKLVNLVLIKIYKEKTKIKKINIDMEIYIKKIYKRY